jgi:hypothetical protein
MPTEDLIYDDTLFSDEGLSEKGLMALRAFVAGGYVQARIEDDDLLLYTIHDYPNGDSEDIELGRINLYHVVGFTAQDWEADQLNTLATLFRNIATLIEVEAMVDRHPAAEGFSWTTSAPQFFRRGDDESEQDNDDEGQAA